MRLTDFEKNSILDSFKLFSDDRSKIYLFGSRVEDAKRGGDIDLLVVFVSPIAKLNFKRLDFLVVLRKKIGERKIDITLATEDELLNDVFLMSIVDSAVRI